MVWVLVLFYQRQNTTIQTLPKTSLSFQFIRGPPVLTSFRVHDKSVRTPMKSRRKTDGKGLWEEVSEERLELGPLEFSSRINGVFYLKGEIRSKMKE